MEAEIFSCPNCESEIEFTEDDVTVFCEKCRIVWILSE